MKNSFISRILLSIVLVIALTVVVCISVTADSDPTHGSHGFYGRTDSSVVNGKSMGFMLDFMSDSVDGICSYYSTMNFRLDTKGTINHMKNVDKIVFTQFEGGGAYAGFQMVDTPEQRKGIMSFWKYTYRDLKTNTVKEINAKGLYGKFSSFSGEGEGVGSLAEYPWQVGNWYRHMIYLWEDEETGRTMIGSWYYDYENDVWTLFACYDTNLWDSYLTGNIGQFMECWTHTQRERYRHMAYRNIYYLSKETNEWVSSPNYTLETDGNWRAWGEAHMGQSEDETYAWAWVNGASEIDTDEKIINTYTLKQDDTITVGTPALKALEIGIPNRLRPDEIAITWETDEHSTPQLSYVLELFNEKGESILKKSESRPYIKKLTVDKNDITAEKVKAVLTITDMFGQSTSIETVQVMSELPNYTVSSDMISGEFGTNNEFIWFIEGDLLTIEGNGDMPDFSWSGSTQSTNAPWFQYSERIKKIIVSDGITKVGATAFCHMDGL